MDTMAFFKLEEKMYRGLIIALIIQLGFFIHGCTTLKYMDGSSKEELKKYKMTKYEMIREIEKAKADNVNLQRQIDILNTLVKEKQRIIDEKENKITEIREENKSTAPRLKAEHEKELARLRQENELLGEQINKLQRENQRMREEKETIVSGLQRENDNELVQLRQENELLREQITRLKNENQRMREEKDTIIAGLQGTNDNELDRLRGENELLRQQIQNVKNENQKVTYENKSLVKIINRQKGALSSQSNALKKYLQKLKIKVLSIDSKNAAEKMAKRLNEIGYDIKSVSYAPQSKFSRNTVYFTQEFKDEAEQLVVSLGGTTTFKPLNWPSVFDLIVVTGKNP
jgi:septal ring factor EnvC (AmiA/AmiB activator)